MVTNTTGGQDAGVAKGMVKTKVNKDQGQGVEIIISANSRD